MLGLDPHWRASNDSGMKARPRDREHFRARGNALFDKIRSQAGLISSCRRNTMIIPDETHPLLPFDVLLE